MNEQLKHIFDDTACLNRRQMKDYVANVMAAEERHAAEAHLNCCPFCSEALDGMQAHKQEVVGMFAELNPQFIRQHFELTNPQVHLNSMSPAYHVMPEKRTAHHIQNTHKWRTILLVSAILLAFTAMWYVEFIKDMKKKDKAEHSAAKLR
jgi:hypothetical protein